MGNGRKWLEYNVGKYNVDGIIIIDNHAENETDRF